MIDFKSVKFTEPADALFESKMKKKTKPMHKMMRKVQLDLSKESAMQMREGLNLISLIYQRKS